MKILNTNIHCTFHYKLYKKKQHVETDGITHTHKIKTNEYAKSIDEVPYWRLYIVKIKRIQTPHGIKFERTIVYKSVGNHNFTDICDLMARIGNPKDNYMPQRYSYYRYECWPRATMCNKYDNKNMYY